MEKVLMFFQSKKKPILIGMIIILAALVIAALSTTPAVNKYDSYTTKEDVSRYIYKYADLPINFITGKHASKDKHWNISDMINKGYNQGGDTFENRSEISNHTDSKFLKEADIYTDRNALAEADKRGIERLVYTTHTRNIEIFYTNDHYDSYEQVSKFELYLTSNILWIFFGVSGVMTVLFIVCLYYDKNYNNKS